MPIDFIMTKTQKANFRRCVGIAFPEKIRLYLCAYQKDFSDNIATLLKLNDMSDVLLSKEELSKLLLICDEISNSFNNIVDYDVYSRLKTYDIKKEELLRFAYELSNLIKISFDDNNYIWSVGE